MMTVASKVCEPLKNVADGLYPALRPGANMATNDINTANRNIAMASRKITRRRVLDCYEG
jgi:hypothetical protein